MLNKNPLFLRVRLNTTSARQVEVTDRKSSHTGIELAQLPTAVQIANRVSSRQQSATFWEKLYHYTSDTMRTDYVWAAEVHRQSVH